MNRYKPLFESEDFVNKTFQKAVRTIDGILASDTEKLIWLIPIGAFIWTIKRHIMKTGTSINGTEDAMWRFKSKLMNYYDAKNWDSTIVPSRVPKDLKHLSAGVNVTLELTRR